ncbi:Mtn21-like protein, putative isoform 2 [Theobroma cacao]|uniref:WAT1-related protein n=1 Tax=Theobroma cacao TaxID=3641 RepID=A0A061DZA8_THECC|nr:Mtn21-like protein, putative isoform 2 [Theobroma cacao]
MGKIGNLIHGLKPPMLMVLSQVMFAGVNVMYKFAANDGMNLRIIIAYRFMFATAVMVPLALILERKSLGEINGMVLFYAFLCGLFGGAVGQNLYLQSLVYTSATFVSAMINLAPAITFILAIFFKLEKLGLGTVAGKAKVLGTLLGIGGAMVFTFYKGVEINIWSTHVNLLHHHQQSTGGPGPSSNDPGRFILGAFLGLLSCISFALWLIIQGIMGSAFMVFLVSWGIRLRGPLYASIFNPLGLVFVAIAGSLILDEKLHMGSILGGILIVCGLYVVLWGKAKEMKQNTRLVPATHESERTQEVDQIENKERAEAVPHNITIQP